MKLKKILGMLSIILIGGVLMSCGELEDDKNKETVVITSLNQNKEKVELEVPYDPKRIAILDLASLDILDNLNLGDRVVGCASTSIDYLSEYANANKYPNIGTIKVPDLEKTMQCDPDIIFIGGRLASYYNQLSEIAPTVYLATDTEEGVVASTLKNAMTIASIFGKESEVESKMASYSARIEALRQVAENKNAVIGMVTSGGFNTLSNSGRCSIIGVEIGFTNVVDTAEGGSHGNETSFEYLLRVNPDYIFVMDRDSAIGTEGALLAKDVLNNAIVKQTQAYLNDQIVYLDNSNVWYTAEGGITALGIMLNDLEKYLL